MKPRLIALRHALGRLFRNHKIFYFLNGLMIGVLFYFYSESIYEKQLFGAIAENIRMDLPAAEPARQDSIIARSLRITHYLEKNRVAIFGAFEFKGFKAETIQPVTFDLMTGKGACGSNAYVLARVLQEFKIPVRVAQMKVNGYFGGHIIVEAKPRQRWIVLDALYELAFTRPDGKLAGFQDIKADWEYYRDQVPLDYDSSYRYEDVQYTNWNKIPVLMPALRQLLVWVKGEEYVNTLSLRAVFLQKFSVLFYATLTLYILILLIRLYLFRLIHRKQASRLLAPLQAKRHPEARYSNFSE